MRLEELERELRAERPDVDPEFARKLDEWADAGFPRGGELDPRSPGNRAAGGFPATLRRAWERVSAVPPRQILAPAGAAVVLIVVAGVGISRVDFDESGELASLERQSGTRADRLSDVDGGDGEHTLSVPEGGPGAAEALADKPATDATAGFGSPPAPGGGGIARGTDERLEDKTARLSLGADADEVQGVANDVVGVTDRHDGIVLDSQVTSDQGGARASFQLEIPASELDATLTDLSELADVISRTDASQDITQPFVRAQREYAATLERIEEQRRRLIEADTQEERQIARLRIQTLKAQASAYEAQRNRVARQARFATLVVEITSSGPDSDGGGWSLGDAADDAGDVLRTIAGVALVSLAVVVPIALVGALAFWLVSTARNRRRERALDS